MKMFKKVVAMLLCAATVIVSVGCQAQAPAQTEAQTAADPSKPFAGKKIGFAHLTLMDEWCVSVGQSIEDLGKGYGASDVNVQVAEFDLEKQVKDMENFINQKYDAIFILTGFTDAIIPTIQQAKDAGIPVVAMDGTIEGDPLVSHIVWDQAYTGTVLGDAVADYVEKNLGGKCRIVCLDSKTLEHMACRQVAFLAQLKKRLGDANVTIVNDSDCQTREAAMNAITTINEEYDLVYAASDSNAYGAIAGLQQKGLTSIPVFACGGYGKELYDEFTNPNGQLEGSIVIPGSSIAQAAYDQMIAYFEGKTDIPAHVNCDFYYISRHDDPEKLKLTKPAD